MLKLNLSNEINIKIFLIYIIFKIILFIRLKKIVKYKIKALKKHR